MERKTLDCVEMQHRGAERIRRETWESITECGLKHDAWLVLRAYVDAMPIAFRVAFRKAMALATRLPIVSPMLFQEQELDYWRRGTEELRRMQNRAR